MSPPRLPPRPPQSRLPQLGSPRRPPRFLLPAHLVIFAESGHRQSKYDLFLQKQNKVGAQWARPIMQVPLTAQAAGVPSRARVNFFQYCFLQQTIVRHSPPADSERGGRRSSAYLAALRVATLCVTLRLVKGGERGPTIACVKAWAWRMLWVFCGGPAYGAAGAMAPHCLRRRRGSAGRRAWSNLFSAKLFQANLFRF